LQSIANQIDGELQKTVNSVQDAVSQIVDVTLRTFIEFDWSKTSLTDLDAHLNGPNGSTGSFHVFHPDDNTGSLTTSPFAKLEGDCTGSCKTEVLTIGEFNNNSTEFFEEYRVSLFNFSLSDGGSPDDAESTAFKDNRADIFMRINQGGTLQRIANGGFRIINGTNILKLSPPSIGTGNTWIAANIHPTTGAVTTINKITNFNSDTAVNGLVGSP